MGDRFYGKVTRKSHAWMLTDKRYVHRLDVSRNRRLTVSMTDKVWYQWLSDKWSGRVIKCWCGYVPPNQWVTVESIEEGMMSFLKKLDDDDLLSPPVPPPVDEGFMKKYPATWEYLTADAYPSGEVRERATLLVLVDGSEVKLCLNDRATNRTLWTTARTLDNALNAQEKALQAGAPAWRVAKPRVQPPAKGKR